MRTIGRLAGVRSIFVRAVSRVVFGVLCVSLAPISVAAQSKRAFVVGIDRYDNLPANAQLKKAVGDSLAMAKTLNSLGFEVTSVREPTRSEFIAKWYQFLERVMPGDTIAFVFSGHGIELEGVNFLLLRDVPRARSGREGQLRSESIAFGQLLTDMREREPVFSFVVLDACRDNPFDDGTRTVGGRRGLGRVEPLEGTFVMFSAGAGQTALDRLDDADTETTSVFTRTLLPLMRKPGVSLLDMADQVGEQVQALAKTAGHHQTPAFYSRVIGGRRVCLAGCEVASGSSATSGSVDKAVVAAAAEAERLRLAEMQRQESDRRADEAAWETARAVGSAEAFRAYFKARPQGNFAREAQQRIAALDADQKMRADEEQARRSASEQARKQQAEAEARRTADEQAWAKAEAANRLEAYKAYLASWPTGAHRQEALQLVAKLTALAEEWGELSTSRSLPKLQAFVDAAAGTEFSPLASSRLQAFRVAEEAAWESADKQQRLANYEAFLAEWREGVHAASARKRIEDLRAIASEWSKLRSSDDEQTLEAFVQQHGWSEYGAEATARLVALRRERSKPGTAGVKTLVAEELLAALDGATLRFTATGETISFDTRLMPNYRSKLGNEFLKRLLNEDLIAEGAFKVQTSDAAAGNAVEGIGGIVRSKVDKTGSVFLLQMHGSERVAKDVDGKDRRFKTFQIVQDAFGYVCITTNWHSILSTAKPSKMPERCTMSKKK